MTHNRKQPLPVEPKLVDIPTAAAMMSTTVFAVRELCRSGELIYVPIGHKWLISPGAIDDFIQRQTGGGTTRPEQEAPRRSVGAYSTRTPQPRKVSSATPRMDWATALIAIEKNLFRIARAITPKIMEGLREDLLAPSLRDSPIAVKVNPSTSEIGVTFGPREWSFNLNGEMTDCATLLFGS
jgi:hypothetical protein